MPVLANFETIWVIIIIFSVISQIVKSIKKGKTQTPGVTPGSQRDNGEGDYKAPDEALQEFLKSLTGQSTPERTAPPPSATQEPWTPVVTRPLSASHRTESTPRRPISAPRGQQRHPRSDQHFTKPPAHLPAPVRETPRTAPMQTLYQATEYGRRTDVAPDVVIERASPGRTAEGLSLFDELRRDLASSRSSRKAMLLREILGPCAALRAFPDANS